VAIIGGGIGGLTLANFLQRAGWGQVTVFEQWPVLKARGGGISIMPEGLGGSEGVLRALGLHEKVVAVGLPTTCIESSYNGHVITKMPLSLGTRVMREALQKILFESLRPGTVRFGASLRSFHEDGNRVQLEFSDNSADEFDLVVAADGINSAIASQLHPNGGKKFAGAIIFSCLARGEFIPEGMAYEHHVNCGDYGFTVRAFSGAGFDGRWDSCNFNVRSNTPVSSSWDAEGTKEQIAPLLDAMAKHGRGCPAWLVRLVEASERVMRWGIFEHGLKPSWCSPTGRVVLLGDAAHAMAPFRGLGAQSAMLDAQALASQLTQSQSLTMALSAYEEQRKSHCEQLMSQSKFEGVTITSFGLAAAYRNSTMRLLRWIHLSCLQSPLWCMRCTGQVLLKLHHVCFLAADALSQSQKIACY